MNYFKQKDHNFKWFTGEVTHGGFWENFSCVESALYCFCKINFNFFGLPGAVNDMFLANQCARSISVYKNQICFYKLQHIFRKGTFNFLTSSSNLPVIPASGNMFI